MNSFPILAIGVALLWSTTVASEEPTTNQDQNKEVVQIFFKAELVEDQASPGKFYTCVQVFLGALGPGMEMTDAWVELIRKDALGQPYVFARHRAIQNIGSESVTLLALFPGKHADFNVSTGFDLKNIITEERRRVQIGLPLPKEDLDADKPINLIPAPEPPEQAKPEVPAPKEKKAPHPRQPRKSIDGDFLQVLIG